MADPNREQREQRDPAEMRREIAETRSHMEQNINALQSRLDPDRLKYEAKTKIREQTLGRVQGFADNASETVKGTGADVFDTIKQNPLPAALAAIGLGWLFMESRNSSRRRPAQRYASGRSRVFDERYGERYPDYYEYDYDYARRRGGYEPEPMNQMRGRGYESGGMAGQAQAGARQVASNVSDKASQVAGNVSDTASQVAGKVSDTAGQVAGNVSDTASQFASNVSDTASEWADTAQRSAYQAKTRFQEMLDENPLIFGAAALALGAAIGMTLPSTPQEDQLFGEARDNFMQKAQDQAKDTMGKVQQVAQKAGDAAKDAAKDEAQNQKLTTS